MVRKITVFLAALLLAVPLSAQVRQGGAVKADGSESGSGSGTVTTTGTLASGQVALGSGATSITGDAGLTWTGTGPTFHLKFGLGSVGLLETTPGLMQVTDGGAGYGELRAYGMVLTPNSSNGIAIGYFNPGFLLGPTAPISWRVTSAASGAIDLALSRASAGTLLVEDGAGNPRDVQARTVLVGDGTSSAPSFARSAASTVGLYYNATNGGFVSVPAFGVGGNLVIGGTTALLAWNTATDMSGAYDLFASYGGSATLQLGATNAASPVSQTLQSQGSRGGTDTNVAGGNLTIRPGAGTGSATGSSIIFQTPTAGASGTTGQTQTTRLTVNEGSIIPSVPIVSGNYIYASNFRSYTGDNLDDIGQSGTKFKTGYFGTSVVTPVVQLTLATPTTSGDTCTAGTFWADASYLYVCTATNTIKRAALTAF